MSIFFQITETKYSQQSETDYFLIFCGIFNNFFHFMAVLHESHFWKSLWKSIPIILYRCDPYGQTSEQSETFIETFNQLNWFPSSCTSSPGHPQEAGTAWQLSALCRKGGGGHGAPLSRKSAGEGGYGGPGFILHWPSSRGGCLLLWRWQQGDNRAFWPLPGPLHATNAHNRVAAGKLALEGKLWSIGLLTAKVIMVLPAIYPHGARPVCAATGYNSH